MALAVLHHELRTYSLQDILEKLHAIPIHHLLAAVLITGLSYLGLTGYDVLALRYVGRRLPYPKVALASFIAYTFAYNLSVLGGSAARYRLLSVWGLSIGDIARAIAFNAATFWVGVCAVG